MEQPNGKQKKEQLKEEIIDKVKEYYEISFKNDEEYQEGDRINYGGRVFNQRELINLVDASLEFWLTSGRYTKLFEKEFASFLGVKYCSLTNSGSSANLLAFMALTSPKLGERRILKGDEVITVAAGFPTTVAPIIQYGAIPVFLDVTLPQYNIDISQLEEARSERTKAVMIAHTLGNPFDLYAIKSFCDTYDLWLIEDNCDALGAEYFYNNQWHFTGTIGDIGTSSFYPPHHMTMGEGGAVYTNNSQLKQIIDSFRDWGRDCSCQSGQDNKCKHRFDGQYGELPEGYDHKYVYSHLGYNLKVTDMQAAVGCAQLEKVSEFIKIRRANWKYLRIGLYNLRDYFILPEPQINSHPSWFGFMLSIKDNVKFTRNQIILYLEERGIQTRMLFAGNLLKQPCFDELRQLKQGYRVVGDLKWTNYIMENSFWIGVYPGIDDKQLDYMIKILYEFVEGDNE